MIIAHYRSNRIIAEQKKADDGTLLPVVGITIAEVTDHSGESIFLQGSIKWDGCSDWWMESYHACDATYFVTLNKLYMIAHELAAQILQNGQEIDVYDFNDLLEISKEEEYQ